MARLTNPAFVELDLNLELSLIIGPTTQDNFSDEDLRVGWEHHRERLMEQAADSSLPGQRPWGWWYFEAGRDQHLTPYPLRSEFEGTEDEYISAVEDYDTEPLIFLAANGHLRDDEIATLAERANDAKLRIGTDEERHGGIGGRERHDQRAVERYERVKRALKA